MSSPDGARTVLITGASSGIGRATALELAGRGDRLVLVARGKQALDAAAGEVRAAGATEVVVAAVDVNDQAALQRVVDDAVARWGRLDAVVHAAQVMAYGRVEDLPADVYETVVDTALHGTANLARTVVPLLRRQERGSLVVVTSLLASITTPWLGAYIAAKWGQMALVRVLQQENRDVPGIAISAVSPGGVDTPIYYKGASYLGSTGRPPPPVYTPQRVARKIAATLDRPRRQVHAGFANPLFVAGFRFFPGLYDAMVGPLMRAVGIARDRVPPTVGNVFESRPETNTTRGRWRGL
jgi:NAD(P)-dependent dehydrogenase (short-subunit alcohol dehydrogenase family)